MQNHSNDLRKMLNNIMNKFDIFILLLSRLYILSFSLDCNKSLGGDRLNQSLYFIFHSYFAVLETKPIHDRGVIYHRSYFNHGK